MEKLRFTFAVLATGPEGKTNTICITSIEVPDGRVFEVPDDLKPASKHTGITTTDVFTKVKNSLKKRHQTRKLWIPLTEDLRKTYLDEGENVQFGDQYLDEIVSETKSSVSNNNNTEPVSKNLGKIAERFLLEKFSGKTTNVEQWIKEFENECKRFEMVQDVKKIEMLKHLMDKQCLDWYNSMIIKHTIDSDWTIWKSNLCESYGNKGWSQIKYAFTFKYQAGSLIEYATKKERLLLEVNKQTDSQTMIHLIVMGLPDFIMDKIDKGKITSTMSLYNELGKYEHTMNKKTYYKKKINTDIKTGAEKIKPCKICEKLNKGTRFHPEERCWFKQTGEHENKKNYKNVNNVMLDVELSDEDQKNA
ncbi:uncharacterized protein LOC125238448 [Leguminivora glycinivorella]|uniref:uncharacterized protein LOC125233851 n=1 Tax=Leguminivora glycinivorella TaxID=1035111 RepID=UPI00200FD8A0|nr:uncharacterized protein LOC125233851 [Leguminivora glycinivorella]XP_048001758.1 uncharacterized protein LOC125238448 [Leguminivora glycinivorella]